MARENDFFLTFGSNAAPWAAQLKKDLAPAKAEVAELQAMLGALQRQAGQSTGGVSRALAGQVGNGGGGGGNQPSSFTSDKLFASLDAASGEINDIARKLGSVVTAMDALPGKVNTVLRSIQGQVDAQRRQTTGTGPAVVPGQRGFVASGTAGSVPTGSIQHAVSQQVRAGLASLSNAPSLLGVDLSKFRPQAGIASVPKETIDKAGADRIVKAINKQTAVLKAGLQVRGGGGGEAGSAPTVVNTVAARPTAGGGDAEVQQLQGRLDRQKATLEQVNGQIGQVLQALAGQTGETADKARELLKNLELQRDAMRQSLQEMEQEVSGQSAADARKQDRKDRGVTRAQQSQESSDARRKADRDRPVISARELEERKLRAARLASPSDPDFLEKSGPQRKGTQRYTVQQLDEMAQAFREVGIEVARTTKTTKAELAERLKAASETYRTQFPEGAELARTSGFSVSKQTELAPKLTELIGDVRTQAQGTQRALEIFRAEGAGGAKRRDAAVGGIETQPGAIGGPPQMIKGREERGSGYGVLYSEEDLQAARELFRPDADRERGRAVELARSADFNPYDQSLDKGIKSGAGIEEQALATAARNRLRDIRLATKSVDQLGQDYQQFTRAFAENGALLKNVQSRITAATKAGDQPDPRDVDQYQAAYAEQQNLVRAGQQIPRDLVTLFQDPQYQAGLARREGTDELTDRNGRPIGDRQIQEARREYYGNRAKTLSDYDVLAQGTGQTTAGLRSGLGTRQLARPIPGLVFTGDGRFRPEGYNGGRQTGSQVEADLMWSPKQTQKIDQATNALTNAQAKYASAMDTARNLPADASSADVTAVAAQLKEASADLVKAGNILANRLAARTQGGLAPSLQSLIGFEPTSQLETQLGVARRRLDSEQSVGGGDDPRRQERIDGATQDVADLERRLENARTTGRGELPDKVQRDEDRRQAARDRAETQRTRRIGPNSLGERGRKAEEVLAARETQLANATERDTEVTAALTKQRRELVAAMREMTREQRDEVRAANARIPEVERELNELQRKSSPLARRTASDNASEESALDGTRLALNPQSAEEKRKGERSARVVSVYDEEIEAKKAELAQLRGARNQVAGDDGGADKGRALAEAIARRAGISQKIAEAAEEGDLKENAGYHAAREEQGRNEAKIKQLEADIEQGGGVEAFEALQKEARQTAQRVQDLTTELAEARAEVSKSNKSIRERQAELRAERADLAKTGPYKREDIDDLYGPERDAATARRDRIKDIDRELADLKKPGVLNTLADQPEVEAKRKAEKVQTPVETPDARTEELRAERARLQQGPHTKTDIALLAEERDAANRRVNSARGQVTRATKTGDAERIAAAEAKLADRRKAAAAATTQLEQAEGARARLREIRNEIGGGGGGGGRGGRGTGGADEGGRGGRDLDILRKILARLNAIHTTLKGGVRMTGKPPVAPSAGPNPQFQRDPEAPRNVPASQRVPSTEAAEAAAGGDAAARAERYQARRLKALAKDPELKDAVVAQAQTRAQKIQTKQTTEELFAQTRLDAATKLLTGSTQDQIATLRRMTSERASDVDIARQQLAVYTSLQEDLVRQGVNSTGRREATETVLKDIDPKTTKGRFDELQKTAKAQNAFQTVDQTFADGVAPGGIFGGDSEFTRKMFGNAGFWSRIMGSTGAFVVRNFTAGFVFGITNALQEVVQQAIQTEATFVRVSHALEATGRSVGTLRGDLGNLASNYAVPLNDVYEIASSLTGLFDTNDELVKGTEIVTQLQLISNGALNAQEAAGAIASIEAAFGPDLEERLGGTAAGMQQIADVLTSVQNNIGTNAEITAEAVASLSGLGQQLGLSYEEVAVYGAQVAKLTNSTGAAAGESFSRVLAATQGSVGRAAIIREFNPTEEAAREAGVSPQIGKEITAALNAGDYSSALRKMQEGWDALSESQRRNLTVALGGQRQARTVAALFSNGRKTIDDIRKAEDSFGDASERASKITRTLNNQIKQFGVNLTTIASNLIQTGILNSLGLILIGTNKLLAAISKLFTFFNYLAESNPITEFGRDATFTLLGLAAAAFVVRKAFIGMRESLSAVSKRSPAIEAIRQPLAPATFVPQGALTKAAGLGERETPRSQRPGVFTAGDSSVRARAFGGSVPGEFRPLSRATGAILRPLGAGVTSVGRGLTRFTSQLDASRVALRAQAVAQEASGGRVAIVGGTAAGVGAVTGTAGRGISAFGDFLTQVGSGQGEQYFGRGQSRIQGASDRLTQRAAQSRLSAGNVGNTRFQSQSLRALASAQAAGARSAGLAASAVGRLSSGMARLSAAGIGADLALGLIAAAVTSFALEMKANAELDNTLDKIAAQKGFRSQDPGTSEDDPEEYIGPASQAYAEQGKGPEFENKKFGGITTTAGAALSSLNPFSSTVGQFDNNFNRAFGQQDDGTAYGSEQADKVFFDGLTRLSEVAKQPGVTADKLTAANKEVQQQALDAQERMYTAYDQGEISRQQLLSGLALLEQEGARLNDAAEGFLAGYYNLSAGQTLDVSQLSQLNNLRGTLAPLAASRSFLGSSGEESVKSILGSTGFESDSKVQRSLAAIASAPTQSASLDSEIGLIDQQLAAANVQVRKLTGTSGGDDGKLEEAQALVQQLLSDRVAKIQAFLQTTVDEGQLFAAEAAAGGDLAGSDRAYQAALNRMAQRAREEGIDGSTGRLIQRRDGSFDIQASPEEVQYNAQRRQLQQTRAEDLAAQSVSGQRVRAARGNDPLLSAQADADQAGEVLRRLRDARRKEGDKGASVQQIRDAQIEYFSKSRDLATLANDIQSSALSAQAAATWNDAARSSIETEIAMRALQAAIRNGTPQEQNAARGALAQAQQAEAQAYESQRASAGELAVTQLAPGDTAGIARQQLQNALAAQQFARRYGTDSTQYASATQQVIEAQRSISETTFSLQQANIQLAQAYADARGDTIASANLATQAARQSLAEALRLSGGAVTADVRAAQAEVVGRVADQARAQSELIQSQSAIGIALANAAGDTVLAARRTLDASRRALSDALRRSGGENTTEVNGLRAEVIANEAAARDARLQDQLDTIDFNLQMGKITQSSAITALQEILRTSDLNKQQRRQLLLQIKGMKDELANSQFNFGDIRLPTPYQVRRYVEQRRQEFRAEADAAAAQGSGRPSGAMRNDGLAMASTSNDNRTSTTTIYIDGADTGKVKRIIQETVGGRSSVNTRTTGARRGGR